MSIRDDFFAAKAKGSLWDVAVSIKRGNPLPLDADSIFESYAALEAYAADVLAYPGQVVAVVNADSTGIYYLDQDLAIQPVGTIPAGDNLSVVMDDNDVISLHNYGKVFYKYIAKTDDTDAHYEKVDVSDENPWVAGLQPRVATEDGKLVLGWYEPNPTTIEGVNDQVTAVQGTVSDLVDSVGAPSTDNSEATGLYKEVEDVQEDVKELTDAVGNSDDALDENVQTIWAHVNNHTERIKTLEAIDHSVYATKEELTAEADRAKAAEKAEKERATAVEESLQNQINLILDNPDTENVINSISEFTKYVEEHGDVVEGFRIDINQNKTDIAAEVVRATGAESALSGRLDILEAIDHNAYAAADTALKEELTAEINKKANAEDVTDAIDTAKAEAAADATAKADAAKQAAIDDTATKYATKDELKTTDDKAVSNANSITNLTNRLDGIVAQGGEPNTINTIKVNGVTQTIDEQKAVDLAVPTKFSDLTDDSGFDARITAAKEQADKGVSDASAAAATAATNAEEISKHETRIGNLETTKTDHETRIINLENADKQHATEYTTLKSIVDDHTGTIATKANQTALDAVSSKASANETAINTLNEITIPSINSEIAKKANTADVYTKAEVGTITEGKTLVQMIADAQTAATYNDTEVRNLITAEADRADAAEKANKILINENAANIAANALLISANDTAIKANADDIATNASEISRIDATLKAAIENEGEGLDSIKELAVWIEKHGTDAANMAEAIETNANAIAAINDAENGILAQAEVKVNALSDGAVKDNTDAIAVINNTETGILAQAKSYTNEQIAAIPTATAEILGLIKYDDATIKMNENSQLYVAKISTDILEQGSQILVLNGGTANN